jgi:hypothetical protein
MDDVKWREIPLIEIDWGIIGFTGHTRSTLFDHSNPPRDPAWPQRHEWCGKTLGDLADMGEQQWLRAAGVGVVAVRAIKEIIDRAAAGENVTKQGTGAHPYVPRPWPR